MRLRGVLNPIFHMVVASIMVVVSVWVVFALLNAEMESTSAALDLRLLPVGFALGLGVGIPVGIWRQRALRQALPEVEGQFFLSESNVFRRFREGQNAIALERMGFGTAFAAWFMLVLHTGGRVTLFGTFVFYLLGQYLTGNLVPFVRVWLELRRTNAGTRV